VTPAEILDALAALAEETGLRVRRVPGDRGEDPRSEARSAACGELWVVLVASDTEEERIAVLARALRAHAGPALEARWLPPAVRARLEPPV